MAVAGVVSDNLMYSTKQTAAGVTPEGSIHSCPWLIDIELEHRLLDLD